MHLVRCLPLLFVLLSPMATPVAVAEGDFQIEMILFRQAGEPVIAATVAPDDWNAGSQSLSAGNARSTVLNEQAAKLIPANGYKILLHQAWTQALTASPQSVSLTAGEPSFGHFPLQGTLSIKQQDSNEVLADFWINQFDETGQVVSSERFRQSGSAQTGKLTYIDHGNLGMLIRIAR